MAILNDHFQKFHQNISLDSSRTARIKSAYNALCNFVESDKPLSSALREIFLQGSYRNNTAVRPISGEFDVDVVLAIDATDHSSWWRSKRSPSDVVRWVASRLRTNPVYRTSNIAVRQRKRCVRLVYAGDFHLDIVPAHCESATEGPLEVPDRSADQWMPSHPKGYTQWCQKTNDRTGGKFTRVAKMLKWWVNLKFDARRAPRSIALQTLIGTHMPNNPSSDAEALVCALANLHLWLRDQWLDFLAPPTISNPSLPQENLASNWDLEDYKLFKQRVESAACKACQAYQEENTEKSIRLWRELFGDAFPVNA